jgi:hypothetical protein
LFRSCAFEKVCRLWFCRLWFWDFFLKILQAMILTPENKISQLNWLQSILIIVFICFKIISIYLVGCFLVSILCIRKSLQAMILQAMILGFFFENFAGYDFWLPKIKYLNPKNFNRSQSPFTYVLKWFLSIWLVILMFQPCTFEKICRLWFFFENFAGQDFLVPDHDLSQPRGPQSISNSV